MVQGFLTSPAHRDGEQPHDLHVGHSADRRCRPWYVAAGGLASWHCFFPHHRGAGGLSSAERALKHLWVSF